MSLLAHQSTVEVAGVRVSTEHFIGGRRVASTEGFLDHSPIDGQLLAELSRGGADEVDQAVRAARDAFPEWAALGAAGRAPYLRALAELIEDRVRELAAVECLDTGMLLRSLEARVIKRGASNYRAFADLSSSYEERSWHSNGTWNRVQRLPAGPVGVITPWNAPFMLSSWKTAPALAAGCTVVLKPAEWAPLSCSLLADLVDEAGFPAGVFNVVQGIGEEAGAALAAHPLLRRLSFTGSPETGRLIAISAASNLVPFTGELGGNGPFVVFADADLDAAARRAAAQYDDAGQICLACTRLLVEAEVSTKFLDRLDEAIDLHVVGDPREEQTTVAPLIHRDHLTRVEGFVARARANGDVVLRGGARTAGEGLYYQPTLFAPRSNNSEIVQKEVFGPVLTFQSFADEPEAISLANSTPYGLSATVYTSSLDRADRVGRSLRAGTVWVNGFLVRDLTAPFGGTGISGIGREGGDYGLDFYSDLKTLQITEGSTR
jgi:5-carboxymethyl-2-hydroxymuconic-semialdehyde dehydrogenase